MRRVARSLHHLIALHIGERQFRKRGRQQKAMTIKSVDGYLSVVDVDARQVVGERGPQAPPRMEPGYVALKTALIGYR